LHAADATRKSDHERGGSRQAAPRIGAPRAFACGGRVPEEFGAVGVYGFADAAHGAGVCDDLEAVVAVQVEVRR